MYKLAGIYGRIYAYVAFAFMIGGIGGVIGLLTLNAKSKDIIPIILSMIIGGYMYFRVYRKSPDFLKKRCLIDLTISGLGVAARVSFFFIGFFVNAWWEANRPQSYTLNDGTEVYVYPDDRVYNPSTGKYGRASSDRSTVIWDY